MGQAGQCRLRGAGVDADGELDGALVAARFGVVHGAHSDGERVRHVEGDAGSAEHVVDGPAVAVDGGRLGVPAAGGEGDVDAAHTAAGVAHRAGEAQAQAAVGQPIGDQDCVGGDGGSEIGRCVVGLHGGGGAAAEANGVGGFHRELVAPVPGGDVPGEGPRFRAGGVLQRATVDAHTHRRDVGSTVGGDAAQHHHAAGNDEVAHRQLCRGRVVVDGDGQAVVQIELVYGGRLQCWVGGRGQQIGLGRGVDAQIGGAVAGGRDRLGHLLRLARIEQEGALRVLVAQAVGDVDLYVAVDEEGGVDVVASDVISYGGCIVEAVTTAHETVGVVDGGVEAQRRLVEDTRVEGELRRVGLMQRAFQRVAHAVAVPVRVEGIGEDAYDASCGQGEIPAGAFFDVGEAVAVAVGAGGVGAQAHFFAVEDAVAVAVGVEGIDGIAAVVHAGGALFDLEAVAQTVEIGIPAGTEALVDGVGGIVAAVVLGDEAVAVVIVLQAEGVAPALYVVELVEGGGQHVEVERPNVRRTVARGGAPHTRAHPALVAGQGVADVGVERHGEVDACGQIVLDRERSYGGGGFKTVHGRVAELADALPLVAHLAQIRADEARELVQREVEGSEAQVALVEEDAAVEHHQRTEFGVLMADLAGEIGGHGDLIAVDEAKFAIGQIDVEITDVDGVAGVDGGVAAVDETGEVGGETAYQADAADVVHAQLAEA